MNKADRDKDTQPKEKKGQPPNEPTHKSAILKKVREEKGISLDTLHEDTKIPLDILRAIEEGYKVRTLSDFYYRSFVKMYANYLGVDINEALEESKKEELPKPIGEPIVEFNIQEWSSKILTRERKRKIIIVAGIILAFFVLFKIIGFFMNRKPSPKDQGKIVQKVDSKARGEADIKKSDINESVVEIPSAVRDVTPMQPPSQIQPVHTQNITQNVVLTVRAQKDSWLRVKADGVVVFQTTLRAGAVETWNADDKIEISGRNISQLELELNGKMIGSLGRASRRAKGLIATKDGLSVTQ